MSSFRKPPANLGEHKITNSYEYTDLPYDATPAKTYKKHLKVKIIREEDREIEFDLIGCFPALANAFRRILLSEVPSMAIEKVYIVNNTSLIPDDVLAHRFGLIPLRADPRLFEYPPSEERKEDEVSDQDTLRYEIKVACTKNSQRTKNSFNSEEIYKNSNVYSKEIKWVPIGQQSELFPNGTEQLGVLESDILLVKMRPGQEVHAFMHAVKGIGRSHAKFIPVATASYRFLPSVQLTKPVRGEKAARLATCFNPGVIEVRGEVTETEDTREAFVLDARYETGSRNVFSHEDLADCVRISRIPNHFVYTIESLGTLTSGELFMESIKMLKNKCKTFIDEIENLKK